MNSWLQKNRQVSVFKIITSNLVHIPFDTFKKDLMIQNFDFLSQFWEKIIFFQKFSISKKFFKFFFQFFFSQNLEKKNKILNHEIFFKCIKGYVYQIRSHYLENWNLPIVLKSGVHFFEKNAFKVPPLHAFRYKLHNEISFNFWYS